MLTINVLNIFKPNDVYVLINITNENPKELVVNPLDSVLYWNHIGIKSKIMRSSQDGTNQTILYSTFKQIKCFTIDIYLKRIFFIDSEAKTLYSIDFNGENERTVINSQWFSDINSINIFFDDIYYSNVFSISFLNKFGLEYKIYRDNREIHRGTIYDTKIIHPLLQPQYENKCKLSECSHLCLPLKSMNISYRCVCPENYILINEKFCVKRNLEPIVNETLNFESDMKILINKYSNISDTTTIIKFINQSLSNLFNITKRSKDDTRTFVDLNMNLTREIRKSSIQSLNESLFYKFNSLIGNESQFIDIMIVIKNILIFIAISIAFIIVFVLILFGYNILNFKIIFKKYLIILSYFRCNSKIFPLNKPRFKMLFKFTKNQNKEEITSLCESESKL
jgi:hypothetical protein